MARREVTTSVPRTESGAWEGSFRAKGCGPLLRSRGNDQGTDDNKKSRARGMKTRGILPRLRQRDFAKATSPAGPSQGGYVLSGGYVLADTFFWIRSFAKRFHDGVSLALVWNRPGVVQGDCMLTLKHTYVASIIGLWALAVAGSIVPVSGAQTD